MGISYNLAIDASNIRGGGGVTHLVELLNKYDPEVHGFDKIIIWSTAATLKLIDDKPCLIKCSLPEFDKSFLHRLFWQIFKLSKSVQHSGCQILFVPGGSYVGNFRPVVTMSQNLLPFEVAELQRYKKTKFLFKLILLNISQTHSFRHSDGIIFLTNYARDIVLKITGKLRGSTTLIPHGLNQRFYNVPKVQCPISEYNVKKPYKVLYVSIIDLYKHQWQVVEAIASLREQGLPVVLDLVGPSYAPALKLLKKSIERYDPNQTWVRYHGSIPFHELHHYYTQADLGLFASSCENMPNILLETMASGLPIACSNRGPMPEVLGTGGLYFDPEQSIDIARVLKKMIDSPKLREELANLSYSKVQSYTWQRCADETFQFLATCANKYKGNH